MTQREELTILQRSLQKACDTGFHPQSASAEVLGIDIILDPPSVVLRARDKYSTNVDASVYFDPLYPLIDRSFGVAFWGTELTGDGYFGLLPAWKYHQLKLLTFIQNDEQEEFYRYIEIWI